MTSGLHEKGEKIRKEGWNRNHDLTCQYQEITLSTPMDMMGNIIPQLP